MGKCRENGKESENGEIERSISFPFPVSPTRFRFRSPQLPRALFWPLPIPQPIGKRKETSAEERGISVYRACSQSTFYLSAHGACANSLILFHFRDLKTHSKHLVSDSHGFFRRHRYLQC